MYEISQAPVKMNYLLALARLLQGIPNHLIQTEISSVVIVLVRCLDTDKPEVLLTALDILTELLKKQEKILADYIISFVPRLLHLSKFVGYMQIRIKALKCLFFYGFYQTFALLPLKNKVIKFFFSTVPCRFFVP